MTPPFTLRLATAEDIPALHRLIEQSIRGLQTADYTPRQIGSDSGPNRIGAHLNSATDPAKIRAIFVHPGFSRRGLGSLILAHCEQAARFAGFRSVEMGSTLTGVPLYTLRGYREQDRIDVPLPNGEVLAVVRMSRQL